MEVFKNVEGCRICGSKDLTEVMKLDPQFLSPTFVKNQDSDISKIKVPLTLLLCDKRKNSAGCGLLQMKETVNPDLLYRNYFYRSATSTTMRIDLKDVVDDVVAKARPNPKDVVIDIGANDCTMLSYFPESMTRIGVEPAKNIDWSHIDMSKITVVNDYFSKNAVSDVLRGDKAQIITCTAMFYDLDDPNKFVSEIQSILAPDGVFCIQLSYLSSMIKNMNFYDICNEHLEYYSLEVLDTLMRRHGLQLFDASLNHVNGGSARVFVAHENSKWKSSENLQELISKEREMNLFDPKTYDDFYKKILSLSSTIRNFIMNEIQKKNLVIGLGASTKGNVLLQLFGIDKKILPCISERNPEKVGLKTLGTDIELISEEDARGMNPSCMLVLPWYFKEEIVKRESEYISNGGKLLFPMPYPHVVTNDGEVTI